MKYINTVRCKSVYGVRGTVIDLCEDGGDKEVGTVSAAGLLNGEELK